MDNCEWVQDKIIDYINHRLNQTDRFYIAVHISKCLACRDELSYLIKIFRHENEKVFDVPAKILNSAFNKIPDNKLYYQTKNYFGLVYDSFQIIGKTLQFAKQII